MIRRQDRETGDCRSAPSTPADLPLRRLTGYPTLPRGLRPSYVPGPGSRVPMKSSRDAGPGTRDLPRTPEAFECPDRALETLQRRCANTLAILDRNVSHAKSHAVRDHQHVDR